MLQKQSAPLGKHGCVVCVNSFLVPCLPSLSLPSPPPPSLSLLSSVSPKIGREVPLVPLSRTGIKTGIKAGIRVAPTLRQGLLWRVNQHVPSQSDGREPADPSVPVGGGTEGHKDIFGRAQYWPFMGGGGLLKDTPAPSASPCLSALLL